MEAQRKGSAHPLPCWPADDRCRKQQSIAPFATESADDPNHPQEGVSWR
jgi:hypothetical protein